MPAASANSCALALAANCTRTSAIVAGEGTSTGRCSGTTSTARLGARVRIEVAAYSSTSDVVPVALSSRGRPDTSSRPASSTDVRSAAGWSSAGSAARTAVSSSSMSASSSGGVGVAAPTIRCPAPV